MVLGGLVFGWLVGLYVLVLNLLAFAWGLWLFVRWFVVYLLCLVFVDLFEMLYLRDCVFVVELFLDWVLYL